MYRRRSTRPQLRCVNLVQNPSFEAGFANWEKAGDIIIGVELYEGMHVAQMHQDPASLWQDVSLAGAARSPLLLSFNLFGSLGAPTPDTTVEVLWLDSRHNIIGQGQRLFIGEGTLGGDFSTRISFLAVTDAPPKNTACARVLFSKADGQEGSFLQIDQVILTPVRTLNLVQNPSFEADLLSWSTNAFSTDYQSHLEGGASAISTEAGYLTQSVPLTNQPPGSSYLLSFALKCENEVTVRVTVQWVDASGTIIGPPGLDLTVPANTLPSQYAFLTYLALTGPAPRGAVTARITFETTVSESDLLVDQVVFLRVRTSNLVQNPSFEDGLNGWTTDQVNIEISTSAYEGNAVAYIDNEGGALWQDISLGRGAGSCFLFGCALKAGFTDPGTAVTHGLIKVIWLDRRGREIGLGLSLVARPFSLTTIGSVWQVYMGITDRAPSGASAARIRITKPFATNGALHVDNIIFGRL